MMHASCSLVFIFYARMSPTSGPTNFMVTSTMSASIALSWSPPARGTVQSYKLTITGGGGQATVSPPSTTHMFSSLTPFTQYMITIAAVDTMGREGDSTTTTVTTILAGVYLHICHVWLYHVVQLLFLVCGCL